VEFPDIVLKVVGSRQKDMVTRGEQGVEVRKNENFSLASYLEEKRLIVESALDSSLVIGNPAKIYEAMRYSLLAGGNVCDRFYVWLPVTDGGFPRDGFTHRLRPRNDSHYVINS